ncbi:hypothetical protein [Roseovarius ramblicola]|uniref:Uncharacterized protein n=1 Tax=Roseovarius ramblicola TaxID=2022336 RepID=A0ABV5I0G8_9RHOB
MAMKEPERRSIPLNDHGLALLGEALALWPGSGEAVGGIRAAQAVLGFPVRVTDPADPEFFWQGEWCCAPEIVTARAFAWERQDFDDFPALRAYTTKDLPDYARYLDQVTPIATRPARPVDDLMKSLDRWFEREVEKRTGIRVGLGTKPIRWGDNYYREMVYQRDIAPPKKRGRKKGDSGYRDGLIEAAMMVEIMICEDEHRYKIQVEEWKAARRRGESPTAPKPEIDEVEACRRVVRTVGWVSADQLLVCEDENGDPIRCEDGSPLEETRIAIKPERCREADNDEGITEDGKTLFEIATTRLVKYRRRNKKRYESTS